MIQLKNSPKLDLPYFIGKLNKRAPFFSCLNLGTVVVHTERQSITMTKQLSHFFCKTTLGPALLTGL